MKRALLSYAKGSTDRPLLDLTIGAMLDQTARLYPDNDALVSIHQGLRYSYRQFQSEVNQCARALLAIGLKKGERIGIWSPNYAEWTILQFGSSKIGAILVNINPSYRVHELDYALQLTGCSALVIATQFKTSNYTDMLRELASELDLCQPGQLQSQNLPTLKSVIRFGDETAAGLWRWQDFMRFGDRVSSAELVQCQAGLTAHDPINIQFTSGTTGRPKGATLSHSNILNNAVCVAELMNFSDRDRLVIPVPLYHCFGMVGGTLVCVSKGATMILPGASFDAGDVLAAVEAERATAVHGVPTMFIAELAHADFDRFDLSSLRTGLMGGSPCPVEVMNAVIERMHIREMEIVYGMTETSPVATQTRWDAPVERRVGTVGQVLPHVEIKIIDPASGETVALETPGEFCTKGYNVMLGYWNDPNQTAAAIDADGWMHTGDLATLDAEGYARIVGRIKDLIIRGGENVYPREIEEFLYTHPCVLDVQVIGVPDAFFGEEVMAWITLRDDAPATEEDIRNFCRGEIAHYKIPRYIKFVTEFPMTVTGKVQKFEMRKQSIAELGLT